MSSRVVHMLAPRASHIELTFSAVDDGGTELADAIGKVFEAVPHNSDHGPSAISYFGTGGGVQALPRC
jgi:hypothetical protein